jgi:hypothetical protein
MIIKKKANNNPIKTKKNNGSGYDAMMNHLISKKGGTPQQYEQLMDIIAYHETGPRQRMKSSAVQLIEDAEGNLVPQGVGKGLFMFEAGEKADGITSVNRTYRELKDNNIPIPDWLEEAYKQKTLDASKLTAEQQKVLFIGKYLQHPSADLGKYASGDITAKDFWGKYHHAGGASTDYDLFEDSTASFMESDYYEGDDQANDEDDDQADKVSDVMDEDFFSGVSRVAQMAVKAALKK